MRSLGSRLAARQEEKGGRPVFGRIHEMRIRRLAKQLAVCTEGARKHFGHGLVNEKGTPAWEDSPLEEGHAFRRYVFDILRCRGQA